MATYPGSQILFEVGTRKELAGIYGVSERTIYRWMNKAKSETGAKPVKARRPRASTLANFKGTRKELANKYKVSERTVYRWLAAAKDKGVDIESRAKTSKYPGPEILASTKTNKKLAEEYDVSVRTINRWKNQARAELTPEEYTPIDETPQSNIVETPETPIESPEEIFEVPDTVDEEYADLDMDPRQIDDLIAISDMLYEQDLLTPDSMFNQLTGAEKVTYISKYIEYQMDYNPQLFYDKESGEFRTDPDWLQGLNIWGDEFEEWVHEQFESDMYEI